MPRAPLWLAGLAGLCCACAEAPAPGLRLIEFRQREVEHVALNEELAFFFSAPLDPSSVTSESLRIVDEEGLEARGERRVRGRALTFLPDLPCAPDLSDGGFRPKRRYRVLLGGFPRPDGLRSVDGALLAQGLVLGFATAGPGDPSPMFLDPFRGPFRLQPRGRPGHVVELEDGRLVLEYGEALEPSSVPRCRFLLSRTTPGAPELQTTVELIENRPDRAALAVTLAGELARPDGRLPGGTYYLTMPVRELRTLGGRRVDPGWPAPFLHLVVPPERVPVDLSGPRSLAEERPAGCDGTAQWDAERGALRLRFPTAAGSGADGPAGAAQALGTRDLHATRLEIEAGATLDLGAQRGPLVLRSQTTLVVRGHLLRRASPGPAGALGGLREDPPTEELLEEALRAPARRGALEPWVARLIEPGRSWSAEPWLVLVAGGDLWIPEGGALEVDGNLVLVAGGRIRIEGRALVRGNVWSSEEGLNLAAQGGRIRPLPLRIDEPTLNPLRTSLVFGALTRRVPWPSAFRCARTWLLGRSGAGELDATLLAEPGAPGVRASAAGSARFLLRLALGPAPGEPWDPPALERLEVEGLAGEPAGLERP
ncbi:MAG TPA: hypothetical protein VF530_18870 [Planctomycetota bacterium]